MAVVEELAADERESPDNTTTIEDGVKTMTVDEEPVNDESTSSADTISDEAPTREEPEDPVWTNMRNLLQSDDVEEVIKGMNAMLEESDEATMLLDEYYWDVVPAVAKSVGLDEKNDEVSLLAKKVLRRVGLNSPAKEVPIAVFSHLKTLKKPKQTIALLKTAAVATSRVEAIKIRHNLIGDIAEQCEKILEDTGKPCDSVGLALAVVKPLLPTVAKEAEEGDLNSTAVQAMACLIWVCLQALDNATADDSSEVDEDKLIDYQPPRGVTELVYLLSDTPGLGITFLLKHPRRAAYRFWKDAKEADLLPMTLEECASYGDLFGSTKPPILLEYRNWGIRLKQKEKVSYQKKRPGWLQSMPDANDVLYSSLVSLHMCPNEEVVKSVAASLRQIIASVSTRGRAQLLMKNLENIRIPSVTGLLWDILRENMVQARKGAKAKRETKGDEDAKKKKIPFLGEEVCTFMTARTKATMSQATPNKPEALLEQVDNLSGIISIWKFMIKSSKPVPPGAREGDERYLLDDPWKVRDRGTVAPLQLSLNNLKDELEYTNDKDPRLGLLLHSVRELSEVLMPLIEALYVSSINRM